MNGIRISKDEFKDALIAIGYVNPSDWNHDFCYACKWCRDDELTQWNDSLINVVRPASEEEMFEMLKRAEKHVRENHKFEAALNEP